MPGEEPRLGRLWLNDGSCIRLRAEQADDVRPHDFVHHQTHGGQALRTLNFLNGFTSESLAIRVRRNYFSADVIDVLTDLFILHGIAVNVRPDNGPAFVAETVRRWIAVVGARTAFIEPGSPRGNDYIGSLPAVGSGIDRHAKLSCHHYSAAAWSPGGWLAELRWMNSSTFMTCAVDTPRIPSDTRCTSVAGSSPNPISG